MKSLHCTEWNATLCRHVETGMNLSSGRNSAVESMLGRFDPRSCISCTATRPIAVCSAGVFPGAHTATALVSSTGDTAPSPSSSSSRCSLSPKVAPPSQAHAARKHAAMQAANNLSHAIAYAEPTPRLAFSWAGAAGPVRALQGARERRQRRVHVIRISKLKPAASRSSRTPRRL